MSDDTHASAPAEGLSPERLIECEQYLRELDGNQSGSIRDWADACRDAAKVQREQAQVIQRLTEELISGREECIRERVRAEKAEAEVQRLTEERDTARLLAEAHRSDSELMDEFQDEFPTMRDGAKSFAELKSQLAAERAQRERLEQALKDLGRRKLPSYEADGEEDMRHAYNVGFNDAHAAALHEFKAATLTSPATPSAEPQ
jgi:hypothetical protein